MVPVNKRKIKAEGCRFLHGMLGNCTRRLYLTLRWHERCPLKGDSLTHIWETFIKALLYQPLDFCIDSTGVYLFGTHLNVSKAFFIPFEWLTHNERHQLGYLIAHKNTFFKNKEKIYHGGQITFSGFIANTYKKAFPMEMRKMLLRDFCSLVYQITPPLRVPMGIVLQNIGIEHVEPFCILMSKTLLSYTPDGPSLTPIN